MLSEVCSDDTKEYRRHCAVRTVGRVGFQNVGSHRHNVLVDGVLQCSSAPPLKRHRAGRKSAVDKIRAESTVGKDTDCDGLMMSVSSNNANVAKPNHRRSSLQLDYRWLAGMTPKWWANTRKRRSDTANIDKQLEMVKLDNRVSVPNNTDMSQCGMESSSCETSDSLLTILNVHSCGAVGIQTTHYSDEKSLCTEPKGTGSTHCQSGEKHHVNRSYMLLPSGIAAVIQSPLSQVNIQQVAAVDTENMAIVRHCYTYKHGTDSLMHSDVANTMCVEGAVHCLSSCNCFCFCDSPSTETVSNEDSVVKYTEYFGCDGRHRLACDLHLVGALETITDGGESTADVMSIESASAAAGVDQHEDFVDNICVDCGCEMMSDDLAQCAFSVPLCGVCSQEATHSVPSNDSIILADHRYSCTFADHMLHPSPQTETFSNSSAVPVCQEAEMMPDVDVVDDITFLSFSSQLLMHKYILTQRNSCDAAAKSSWTELARCEHGWHGSHRSHKRAWFGSMKHRHVDRFNTHNRLNEQIDLGLVRPVSAQNCTDLLGITLKTSLHQKSTNKTVVGKKLKCRNRRVPSDSQVQRPTRLAARGQFYCLTRFKRPRNTLRTSADAEHIDIMKLTQQKAEEALSVLQVPSIITRNDCSQPGCRFGCICHLFANRFASEIGAEFNTSVTLPEIPTIDDSWRQSSVLSSADSSFTSDVDDCSGGLTLDADVPLRRSALVSTSSRCSLDLSLPSYFDVDGKCRRKYRRGHRSINNQTTSSPIPVQHKRRRLKRRLSVDDDCTSSTPKYLEQSLTLTLDGDNHVEPIETHTRKRRRRNHSLLAPLLPSDSDASMVLKQCRRPSTNKKQRRGRPQSIEINQQRVEENATVMISPSQTQTVNRKDDTQRMLTADVNNHIPIHAQLRLQNVSTGKCYILQPVAKGAVSTVGLQGVSLFAAVQPVNTTPANTARSRVLLPRESGHIAVAGPVSAPAKLKLSRSSTVSAVIPRLIRVSESSSSHKSSASTSSASVPISSPISSGSSHHSDSSALTLTQSILKQNSTPTSVSSPSNSICSSSSQKYRTQMILFQQSGQPYLLEITSNCAWERCRSKVLTGMSDLTKQSGGYPQPCTISVDDMRLDVQPKPQLPTEIPRRLRESLGMSSMFPIRVKITEKAKLVAAATSVLLPSAAKSSIERLRECNGLTLGSVGQQRIINRKSSIDISEQSTETDNLTYTEERTVTDLSCQVFVSREQKVPLDTCPQSTIAQCVMPGLLANSNGLLVTDDSGSLCATDLSSLADEQKYNVDTSGLLLSRDDSRSLCANDDTATVTHSQHNTNLSSTRVDISHGMTSGLLANTSMSRPICSEDSIDDGLERCQEPQAAETAVQGSCDDGLERCQEPQAADTAVQGSRDDGKIDDGLERCQEPLCDVEAADTAVQCSRDEGRTDDGLERCQEPLCNVEAADAAVQGSGDEGRTDDGLERCQELLCDVEAADAAVQGSRDEGRTDDGLERCQEPLCDVEAADAAVQGSADSCTYNSCSCTALSEDNAVSSISVEMVNSCLIADDGSFPPSADSSNVPSSGSVAECSLEADDSNFQSSSCSHIRYPADLCS